MQTRRILLQNRRIQLQMGRIQLQKPVICHDSERWTAINVRLKM